MRLLLLFSCAALLGAQTERPYEVAITKNVMVAMRDGVRLAADVYRPGRNGALVDGRFPVLLERTPYNKDGGGAPATAASSAEATAKYFVPRGYAVVIQDVRGRFRSEGRWFPIRDDPNDGFDTARWIVAQPWSDGNIGTIGTSYAGATQHALAIANAPGVKA